MEIYYIDRILTLNHSKKILAIAIFAILSSCATIKTSTSKTIDINEAEISQLPLLVDLDVKETKVLADDK